MISYETFLQYLKTGKISGLNFTYESKEYLIARESEGENFVYVFLGEDRETEKYASVDELSRSASVSAQLLSEVWENVTPICNDTLSDKNYVETLYSDSLGKIVSSASGTAEQHERYLTQYCLPSIIAGILGMVICLLCTLFIKTLTWTFFGIAAATIVFAFGISQIIFVANTKRFRRENPRAHMYLLEDGALILTDRFEFSIPYEKIIRLDCKAGLEITTLKTVFLFTPNSGKGITETLKAFFDGAKAMKAPVLKKKHGKKR